MNDEVQVEVVEVIGILKEVTDMEVLVTHYGQEVRIPRSYLTPETQQNLHTLKPNQEIVCTYTQILDSEFVEETVEIVAKEEREENKNE